MRLSRHRGSPSQATRVQTRRGHSGSYSREAIVCTTCQLRTAQTQQGVVQCARSLARVDSKHGRKHTRSSCKVTLRFRMRIAICQRIYSSDAWKLKSTRIASVGRPLPSWPAARYDLMSCGAQARVHVRRQLGAVLTVLLCKGCVDCLLVRRPCVAISRVRGLQSCILLTLR